MRTQFHLPKPIKTACASVGHVLNALPSLTEGIRSKFNHWRANAHGARAAVPNDSPQDQQDHSGDTRANFQAFKASLKVQAETYAQQAARPCTPTLEEQLARNEADTKFIEDHARQRQQMDVMGHLYGKDRYQQGLDAFFNQGKK